MTKRRTKKKKSGGESPGDRERERGKTDGAEKRQAVRR